MIYSSEPFCDWADVTCSPEESFLGGVHAWLRLRYDTSISHREETYTLWKYGAGTIRLDYRHIYHRVSLSGGALSELRGDGVLDEFLFLLATVPHSVTRLDAAQDVPVDGPKYLRRLEAAYPTDRVSLGRKALPVTRFYSARATDGQQTGTWYVGRRQKVQVSARVYDKVQELAARSGLDGNAQELALFSSMYPQGLTRVELTFRKAIGCTLRDISMPSSLFYEYSDHFFIKRPESLPRWTSASGADWARAPTQTSLTLSDFQRKLDYSPELESIASLASRFGPTGKVFVMRRFEALLDAALREAALTE